MTNSFPKLAFSFTFAVFERVRFTMGKSVISHRRNGVWLGAESNRRHEDFQSSALPTELPSRIAMPLLLKREGGCSLKQKTLNAQRRVVAAVYDRRVCLAKSSTSNR